MANSEAVRYYDDKLVAATIFTPESKIAYCTSCGEEISSKNKIVEVSGGKNYVYNAATGMWVLTVVDTDAETETTYYIDAVEDTKKQTADGRVTVLEYTDGKYTEAETLSADVSVSLDANSLGGNVRALRVQVASDEYFYITDGAKADTYKVIKNDSGSFSATSTFTDDEDATVAFVANHNHRYNTDILTSSAKDSEKAENIYFDPSFKVMTYLNGFSYIEEGTTRKKHYLECTNPDCGLKYFPVEHASEEAGTPCSVCGFDADSEEFVSVKIEAGSDLYLNTDLAKEKAVYEIAKAYKQVEDKIDAGDSTQAKAQAVVDLAKSVFCNAEGKESDAYKAVVSLKSCAELAFGDYTDSDGSAQDLVDELKEALDALYTAANITVASDADTNYTTTFKNALATIDNDTMGDALYDAVKAIETNVAAEKKESMTFFVKPSTILPLTESRSFTDFFGYTVNLAENTGWAVNDSTRILMEDGFKVVRDGGVLCIPSTCL